MNTVFQPEFVLLNSDAGTSTEIISKLGSLLISENRVKNSFVDAVLERERNYPTGLPTKEIYVAIPHAESSHVYESSIGIATLENPVSFGLMGNPDKKIDVQIVMLMAIEDSKKHLELLKELMRIFSDTAVLQQVKNSGSSDEIVRLLRQSVKSKYS